MRAFNLILAVCALSQLGCSNKLEGFDPEIPIARTPASTFIIGPGQTPTSINVEGAALRAEITLAPSQQIVGGSSITGKISIQ